MTKANFIKISLWVLLLEILASGCASTGAKQSIKVSDYKSLEFKKPLNVSEGYEVTDKSNPGQLICKGIEQAERGRHGNAASFFSMVAYNLTTDNSLKIVCLFASANEYLISGDRNNFIKVMKTAVIEMNQFQLANLSDEEQTLVALYNLSIGKKSYQTIFPSQIRALFYTKN